jgi:hypothetical protein
MAVGTRAHIPPRVTTARRPGGTGPLTARSSASSALP